MEELRLFVIFTTLQYWSRSENIQQHEMPILSIRSQKKSLLAHFGHFVTP